MKKCCNSRSVVIDSPIEILRIQRFQKFLLYESCSTSIFDEKSYTQHDAHIRTLCSGPLLRKLIFTTNHMKNPCFKSENLENSENLPPWRYGVFPRSCYTEQKPPIFIQRNNPSAGALGQCIVVLRKNVV